MKSQLGFISDNHSASTKEFNKIALSSNDNKRIKTHDEVTTYPYGTNAFKICESEMLVRRKSIPMKLYYDKI